MFIDLGGNLLPGFAGGMKSVRVCAERLGGAYGGAVAASVLTPRYNPAKMSVGDFVELREKVLRDLSLNMPQTCPVLYLGCEVFIDERLKYISEIGELTVLGTRTMIAYMPEGFWDGALLDTLEAIRATGIDVLIAHIDRYPERYAEDLFKFGYKATLDVSAFFGMSNLRRRKKLFSWIDEGYVAGISGNLDDDGKRVGEIARFEDVIGEERAARLAESSARVLAGAVNITK